MALFGTVSVEERKNIVLVQGVSNDFYLFRKINSNIIEPTKIRGNWKVEREVYEQLWVEGYIIV